MAIFSIGSNSRDYPDTAAFIADLPATLTEQMRGQHYNDSEFTTTAQILLPNTITTTAAFNIVLEAAPGESFRDSGNHLRYDVANGVGIRKTNSYGNVLRVDTAHTEVVGLQFSTTGTNNTIGLRDTTNLIAIGNLFNSSSNVRVIETEGPTSTYVNNVIIANEGSSTGTEGMRMSYSAPILINNTFVCLFPGSTAFGIEKSGGAADNAVLKNNAIFGFGTAMESGSWGSGTDYNATDNATLPVGSNNLTSLTFADQFENIASDSTLDLRLKAGNDLDGSGTPDALTNDEDIFFNSRSLTTPSIGAFETVSGGGGIALSVGSGTYNYTGNASSLLLGRVLQAGPGAYSYDGASVKLLRGHLLSASTGNYSYTGTDAVLTFTPVGSFTLTADTGSYTYTGADINFNRNRVIIATSGFYTYSGTDIQIILPGQVWTDKASDSTFWESQDNVDTDWAKQTNVTTTWTDK